MTGTKNTTNKTTRINLDVNTDALKKIEKEGRSQHAAKRKPYLEKIIHDYANKI